MSIDAIFSIVELFKIVTYMAPCFYRKTGTTVNICNALTMASTMESYGIQEVRGSIPLVSTRIHAGLRIFVNPLFIVSPLKFPPKNKNPATKWLLAIWWQDFILFPAIFSLWVAWQRFRGHRQVSYWVCICHLYTISSYNKLCRGFLRDDGW